MHIEKVPGFSAPLGRTVMPMSIPAFTTNPDLPMATLGASRREHEGLRVHKNLAIEKLRAVAIIFVILWHYKAVTLDVWGVRDDLYQLGSGVDLFFAISGYVICSGLLKSGQDNDLRSYLKQFYIKRIFRITPAAVFWVLISVLVAGISMFFVGDKVCSDTIKDIGPALFSYANVAYYFKTANHGSAMLGVYWSLSLEEQFYLIIPLLLWIFRKRAMVLVCGLGAWALLQFTIGRPPWGTLWWSLRTDGLIYGVLIAMLAARKGSRPLLLATWLNSTWVLRLVRGVLIVMLATLGSKMITTYTQLSTGLIAVSAGALVLLAIVERECSCINASDRVLLWIGSRSYALYLVHNIVIVVYKGAVADHMRGSMNVLSPEYYIVVGALFVTVAVLAEFSYRIIEVPLRNHGRRLADSIA